MHENQKIYHSTFFFLLMHVLVPCEKEMFFCIFSFDESPGELPVTVKNQLSWGKKDISGQMHHEYNFISKQKSHIVKILSCLEMMMAINKGRAQRKKKSNQGQN